MMDKLRQLPPWQIIAGSAVVVLAFLVGGYFLVTTLTSTPPAGTVTSQVPANLDGTKNRAVVKQLDFFEEPGSLPILTEPLRTPDPNSPSVVNPFAG
jgi:hypothetical protein